jgi:hypothetical protein
MDINEQILKRVCSILDTTCDKGLKDEFVLKLCNDLSEGACLLVNHDENAIYSLHPDKQDV